MYADREEAALEERRRRRENGGSKQHKQRESWAYSSSVSRSVSRSPSRSRSVSRSPPPISPRRPGDVEGRERELQEQLRKRAMMSKGSRSTANTSKDQPSRSVDGMENDSSKHRSSRSPDLDRKRYRERSERRQGRRDLLDKRSNDGSEDEEGDSTSKHRRKRRAHRHRDEESSDLYRSRPSEGSRHGGESEADEGGSRHERRQRRSSRTSEDESSRRHRRSSRRSGSYYDSPRSNGGGGSGYYDAPYGGYGRYDSRYGPRHAYYDASYYRYQDRSPSPPPRRRTGESRARSPNFDDYELRSVFCSQLAARLTQRDLGEFFEEKLGEGSVMDVKIVMDKITSRSKG